MFLIIDPIIGAKLDCHRQYEASPLLEGVGHDPLTV